MMVAYNSEQLLGRAKNFVLDYFTQKLLLPKVYLDAEWNNFSIPVLAIDRVGVGDVHAALFIERNDPSFAAIPSFAPDDIRSVRGLDDYMAECMEELFSIPCQFRYIAIYDNKPIDTPYQPFSNTVRRTLAPDGIGRIGILTIDATQDAPHISVAVKPERFRSSKEIINLTDQYVAKHTAAWEVRE
jgi:hypothetical protein